MNRRAFLKAIAVFGSAAAFMPQELFDVPEEEFDFGQLHVRAPLDKYPSGYHEMFITKTHYPISHINCGTKFGKTFMGQPEGMKEAWHKWAKEKS